MTWDINLFNWIHGLAGWSVFTDTIGVFLAQYLAYLLALAALVFIFRQNDWKSRIGTLFHLALAALISRGILTEIIRYLYERPRPFAAFGFSALIGESGNSFPSGHAAFFFALGFIIFSMDRKWGYWFLSLAFLNGLARVFVGVHYPTDILGGILMGFIAWRIIHLLLDKHNASEAVKIAETDVGNDSVV